VTLESGAITVEPEEASLISRVAFETTAALSRMPDGHRLAPAVVLEWLGHRFGSRWFALPAAASRRALRTAVDHGIRGGALYDVLIAATALHHRHTLVSTDRRAATAYSAVGVDAVYIVAG
jgi:hypothetical protein